MEFRFLPRNTDFPLFTPFHIPQNPKIFHGIPHVESAFYPHPDIVIRFFMTIIVSYNKSKIVFCLIDCYSPLIYFKIDEKAKRYKNPFEKDFIILKFIING